MASSALVFIVGIAIVSLAGTVNSIPSSVIVDSVASSQRSLAIGVYRVVGDSALTVAPILSGWLTDTQGFRAAGVMSVSVATTALFVAFVGSRHRAAGSVPYSAIAESPTAR